MIEPSEKPKALNTFQVDIGNLRSHHWKYWIDLYTNCYYDCSYCVYRGADGMGKIQAHPERIGALVADLRAMPKKGIVYLGPRSDVYQPIERRKRLARRALEAFLETETPVFVVTRSELVLNDLDVLRGLAEKGLVELSITIASSAVIAGMEPNTLPVRARLDLIRELRRNSIPVSVHMSPIVPYLDSMEQLQGLLNDIHSEGVLCTYACMLGVTSNYEGLIETALASQDPTKARRFRELYPVGNARTGEVRSAPDDVVHEIMTNLSTHSRSNGIPFACVHLPILDTVEREGGIFRYKVPTVGDMVRHFHRSGVNQLTLPNVLDFVQSFDAVDADFTEMVSRFWNEGVLFKNTFFHPTPDGRNGLQYENRAQLDIAVTNMKVA